MHSYTYGAGAKSWRSVFLCMLSIVLLCAVYCGQNKDDVSQKNTGTESEAVGKVVSKPAAPPKPCKLCGKPINPNTLCRITLETGRDITACCAFCAASIRKRIGKQPFEGVTVCYSTGKRIDFKESFFVVESSETTCCAPGAFAFSSIQEAENFIGSKGGKIINFPDLLNYYADTPLPRKR